MGLRVWAAAFGLLLTVWCPSAMQAAAAAVESSDSRVVELLAREAASPTRVITMNTKDFDKYVVPSAKRAYSVIVFLTAEHLLDKSGIQLRALRSEYQLTAASYYEEHKGTAKKGKIFFAEFEFADCQEVFQRVSAQSLPYVFRAGPTLKPKGRAGMVDVPTADMMVQDAFDHYPWVAEDFVSFVTDRTSISATVARPSLLASPIVWAMLAMVFGMGAYVAYKILVDGWFSNPVYSLCGCLLVTWFASSGGMFNIIRGVPFTSVSPERNRLMWYTTGQGQLGAEGYVSGTMYLLFAMSVVTLTHWAPKIQSKFTQRGVTYTALLVATCMFIWITDFYALKTGYRPEYFIF